MRNVEQRLGSGENQRVQVSGADSEQRYRMEEAASSVEVTYTADPKR